MHSPVSIFCPIMANQKLLPIKIWKLDDEIPFFFSFPLSTFVLLCTLSLSCTPPLTLFYKAYYTTMNDSVSDTDVGYDTMGSTGAQRKRNGPNLGTSIQSDFTVMV